MGAILYYSALHAEKTRQDLFRNQEFPKLAAAPSPAGKFNGKPFNSITGRRSRQSVRGWRSTPRAPICGFRSAHRVDPNAAPPAAARHALDPGLCDYRPAFKGTDIGEVIIPAIYPFSWKCDDQQLWLGRATDWVADDEGHEFPVARRSS